MVATTVGCREGARRHFRTLSVGPQADLRVGLRELLSLMPVAKKFNFFIRSNAAGLREQGFSHADPSKRCFDFSASTGALISTKGL